MIRTSIQLPTGITRDSDALGFALQQLLVATSIINADWYLREWDAGRTPECCAKCQGVRYVPDGVTPHVQVPTTPVLFAMGKGSCGPIAATHTGHKIADAFAHEGMPWPEAVARYTIKLQRQKHPSGAPYFHALCWDDGEIHDATAGMQ